MSRRYADFRTAYDHLSDIVHPNGLGAVVYFGTFVETSVMRFDDGGSSKSSERARASLVAAVVMLLHDELALIETEERLKKLSAFVTEKHHASSAPAKQSLWTVGRV